jgi:hypothetical protein
MRFEKTAGRGDRQVTEMLWLDLHSMSHSVVLHSVAEHHFLCAEENKQAPEVSYVFPPEEELRF